MNKVGLLLLSVVADSERYTTAFAPNFFVVALAGRVVISHAKPGSETEALLRYATSLDKPTLIFSDNKELLAIGTAQFSGL